MSLETSSTSGARKQICPSPNNISTIPDPTILASSFTALAGTITCFGVVIGAVSFTFPSPRRYRSVAARTKSLPSKEKSTPDISGCVSEKAAANVTAPITTPKQVIVPARAVNELARIVGSGMVEILLGEGQICFRAPDVELVSRLIEGQYPDYKQIVPKNYSTEAE